MGRLLSNFLHYLFSRLFFTKIPESRQRKALEPVSQAKALGKIEIVIPTRDKPELLSRCVNSILELTKSVDYSVTVVNNGSVEASTLELLKSYSKMGIKVLDLPVPFNFSKLCNSAIAESPAKFICLLNNDTEISHGSWLEKMLLHLNEDRVQLVGSQLLYANGHIQHNGVYFKFGGIATHLKNRVSASGSNANDCSIADGATFANVVFRKETWSSLGGLDERFPVGLNDVDFCARISKNGGLVAICAESPTLHLESASRPSTISIKGFVRAFLDVLVFLQKYPNWYRREILTGNLANRDV